MTKERKAVVVLTTVNIPVLLEDYAANFEKFGHAKDVSVIVIPDLKTPPEAKEVIEKIARQGLKIEYVEVKRQESWLDRFPDLKALIPYNSDNRRNIGFLMALERECDFLISIDDDNYCLPDDDFYAAHAVVGTVEKRPCLTSNTGWFNICSLLDNTHHRLIYPRGYPYAQRGKEGKIEESHSSGFIAVNAGLWTHDPDVDSVTRLNEPDLKITRMNRPSIMLTPQTKTPINTQNTALVAEAIAAYYFVLMGENLDGLKLDRYGDIWSGFLLKKCAEQMGHSVGIGSPLAFHKRNHHNLFKDLREELWCMILTEYLVKWLQSITLKGRSYLDCYRELSYGLEGALEREEDRQITPAVRTYFSKIATAMRVWADVFAELTPKGRRKEDTSGHPPNKTEGHVGTRVS